VPHNIIEMRYTPSVSYHPGMMLHEVLIRQPMPTAAVHTQYTQPSTWNGIALASPEIVYRWAKFRYISSYFLVARKERISTNVLQAYWCLAHNSRGATICGVCLKEMTYWTFLDCFFNFSVFEGTFESILVNCLAIEFYL